jgi:hypothetical protein
MIKLQGWYRSIAKKMILGNNREQLLSSSLEDFEQSKRKGKPSIYIYFFDKSIEFISKKRKVKGGATQLYKKYN